MSEIVTLELSDTAHVYADGKSRILLTAHIPEHEKAAEKYRKVTFETTSGTFEATGNGKREITIDQDGNATAYLVVGTVPGNYFVSATIGTDNTYRVEKEIALRPLGAESKITVLYSDTTHIKADGFSVFKVKAHVTGTPEKTIRFTINEGFILGTGDQKTRTLALDENGDSEVFIKTDVNATTQLLSAEINSLTIVNRSFLLKRAFADTLIIEAASLKTDTTGTPVIIKAILIRSSGKVSLQTPVFFESFQVDNSNAEKPTGRFTGLTNAVSNENGEVSVNFFADTGHLMTDRPIKIRIKTKKDNGALLIKTIDLKIK